VDGGDSAGPHQLVQGAHLFYDLPHLAVPGLPSEAFGLASGAVDAALSEHRSDVEDEPPQGLRKPILERAIEIESGGSAGLR
jgi:hypothetical protein